MSGKLWRVVAASLRVIWAALYGGWKATRDLKRLYEQIDQEAKQ